MVETILVTGGLGYIGSHICVELLHNNYNVVILDNLLNSSIEILTSIEDITQKKPIFYNVDLLLQNKVYELFKKEKITSIIHCAGLKSVNESIQHPGMYYYNNIKMTLNLLEMVKQFKIERFIFSSSATVYGCVNTSNDEPFIETDSIGNNITNPYGESKYIQEVILKDASERIPHTKFIMLRYFNPVGNHTSGLIGDNPNGIPNNLMPYILRVAMNNNNRQSKYNSDDYKTLNIYGNDYNTNDGTCIRDFIHVCDLANAHKNALASTIEEKYATYNIGTGKGYSVLELIQTFININKVSLKYTFKERRIGDVPVVLCNVNKAFQELNWSASLGIEDMVKDSWKYIKMNNT